MGKKYIYMGNHSDLFLFSKKMSALEIPGKNVQP